MPYFCIIHEASEGVKAEVGMGRARMVASIGYAPVIEQFMLQPKCLTGSFISAKLTYHQEGIALFALGHHRA